MGFVNHSAVGFSYLSWSDRLRLVAAVILGDTTSDWFTQNREPTLWDRLVERCLPYLVTRGLLSRYRVDRKRRNIVDGEMDPWLLSWRTS